MKLTGKIIISGTITTLTGLHIGGSKSSLNIGGVDNNVIKTIKGVPYIPGSSLKGKLRSLLAKKEGSLFFSKKEMHAYADDIEDKEIRKQYKSSAVTDEDKSHIIELFGYSADSEETNKDKVNYTSLLVRDAYMSNPTDTKVFNQEEGKMVYTDSKFENVINRRTGTAEHPRQMERVPVGAKFNFEMVYNIYEDADVKKHLKEIILALELLEDDFIGGQGSRGYGQIKITLDGDRTKVKKINSADSSYESDKLSKYPSLESALSKFNN